MKNNDIDIILSNDGIMEGFIGLILSKIYKKPFAYYLSSLFFDMQKHEFLSMPSVKSLIKMIIYYIKDKIYYFIINRSDFFHPISEAMGNYYLGMGVRNNKIFPLPLCPSKIMIETPINEKNKKFDTLTLIYTGQISPVRKIEFLIDILYELKKSTEIPIKLIIVGKIFRNN